jgi:hypothetical protein
VPYSYSVRYVAASAATGGRTSLVETFGDHFSLIDPGSRDWTTALGALRGLLS